jgi:hypothetical protein
LHKDYGSLQKVTENGKFFFGVSAATVIGRLSR